MKEVKEKQDMKDNLREKNSSFGGLLIEVKNRTLRVEFRVTCHCKLKFKYETD